jgi:endonuclease/exonuclease/phosphatase family metal-dependent hydrolase
VRTDPHAPAPRAENEFVALSWNLHKGRSPLGFKAWGAMRHWVQNTPADAYFLQEAQARRQRAPLSSRVSDALRAAGLGAGDAGAASVDALWDCQATDIANELKLQLALGDTVVRQSRRHGNAILSPHPLDLGGRWDISAHRFEQRGLLVATIAVGARRITLLCAHLALTRAARLRQMHWIAEWIVASAPAGPLILAGDFNDWRNDSTALFGAIGLHEVATALGHEGKTFPSFSPALALDKMFVREMTPLAWIAPRHKTAWLSDHLPYMARLRID